MILGLVCAHRDSEGCPDKTMRKLGGRTLLQIALDKARACGLIDRVAVCTNYDMDGLLGPDEVWIPRPYESQGDRRCGPRVPKWHLWRYALEVWEAQERGPAAFVDIDVTRPLTTPDDIAGLVSVSTAKPVAAGAPAKKSPWSDLFVLKPWADGPLAPCIEGRHEARQAQPQVYEYGGLYYCPRQALTDFRNMWEAEPLPYVILRSHAFDVDDELDWEVVQDQWRRQRPDLVSVTEAEHRAGCTCTICQPHDTREFANTGGWR